MDDVRENDQCLFYVGVTIIVMAESKKELDSICETIETIGKRNSCTIDTHFLKQREALNTDSSKMAEVIGVSEVQLRFVTNTASGMGLIKCGSAVVPFDNQISKDTDLYKLYNTNIHERIAEMKAKESRELSEKTD